MTFKGARPTTRGRYVCLVFVLVATITVAADDSVHIRSRFNHQLVTSSTLRWIPHTQEAVGGNGVLVIGGFKFISKAEGDPGDNQLHGQPAEYLPPDSKPIFVCRAAHNGILVPGGQVQGEKRCNVSLLGNVHSYERYELLENVDKGARLRWVHWDTFVQPPTGVVATAAGGIDETFVARCKVDPVDNADTNGHGEPKVSFTHHIGKYDPKERLGLITYVTENGVEASATSGEVLVEIEPISYELTAVKFNYWKKRVINQKAQDLGEANLFNTDAEPTVVAKAIGFSYNHSDYWGQGHAILKGLNTSIRLATGDKLPDIKWGTEIHERRDNVRTVKKRLDPGTAVNVTLTGNYTDMEVPYTAQLVSRYANDTSSTRTITGIRRETKMIDVHESFGPVYFLFNGTLVPTTPAPPTTLPPVIIDKTFEGSDPKEHDKHGDVDENMIVSISENGGGDTDTGAGLQADDGGPLSLENRVDGGGNIASSNDGLNSGVSSLEITFSHVFLLLFLHPRILHLAVGFIFVA